MSRAQDRWWSAFKSGLPASRPLDGCWPWGDGVTPSLGGTPVHHIAWQLDHGEPVPRGKVVVKVCGSDNCVNPAHLVLRSPDAKASPRQPKGPAKLTPAQVRVIRELDATGRKTKAEIARQFRVAFSTIASICNGEHWQDI